MNQDVDATLTQSATPGAPSRFGEQTDPPGEGPKLPRGHTVGRYLVLSPIGQGGMGVVYAAYDPELDRRVALKLVRPHAEGDARRSTRMLREAQAMARLSHPNVVTVHDVGTLDDGHVYLAMELVAGQTLGVWAQSRPWAEIVGAALQAGEGLWAAHRAGLVHRDFKPSNCIVGETGRVRVLDFGLSRALDDETDADLPSAALRLADGRTPMSASLTVAGSPIGTPAYMPPEQYRGEAPDERSDQFSFCVSLWELLLGQRPYAGSDLAAIQRAAAARKLRPVPRRSPVPHHLIAALQRGLDPDPARRFESMQPLLAELRRAIAPRRSRLLTAVLGLGAVGALTWAMVVPSATAPVADPCDGAAALTDPLWAERSESLRPVFDALPPAAAEQAFARVDEGLRRYLGRWSEVHREACEATRVYGVQSERLYDARMACLEQRRARVSTLVELLAEADAEQLRGAPARVAQLPSLARCSDGDALARIVPPPEDPEVAAEVLAVEREVAALGERLNAGPVEDFDQAIAELQARAQATEHAPLLVQVVDLQATADLVGGRYEAARDGYERAVLMAAQAHDPWMQSEIWLDLLRTETRLGNLDRARAWLLVADAAAAAEGVDPTMTARLDLAAARMYEDAGDFESARQRVERSIEGFERTEPDHFSHARALSTLGGILSTQGRNEAAETYLREGLERLQQIHGSFHPQVAAAHMNLGLLLAETDRADEALLEYDRATEILAVSFDPEHPHLATVDNNRGLALLHLGRYEEAIAPLQQAIDRWTRAYGPDDHRVAMATDNLATAHYQLGHHERALGLQQQVVEALQAKYEGPHPTIAIALDNLAQTELRLERPTDALIHGEAALAIRREVFPEDPVKHARSRITIGLAQLELGRAAQAREHLEQAVAQAQGASARSAALWGLAKALHATGADRAHVRSRAADAIAALPEGQADEIAEIRAWLAEIEEDAEREGLDAP